MDQRRFILFLMLSFAVLMASQVIFPPPPPPVQPVDQAAEMAEAKPEEERPDAAQPEPLRAEADAPAPDPDPDREPRVAPPAELQYTTLGSVDPASGYRMLVTFTSRGAGVERVELSNPRYRDLHDDSGYMGHVTGADTGGPKGEGKGLLVRVVGASTPAAEAGLRPGDRILAVGEGGETLPVDSDLALSAALDRFDPGDVVVLQIERDGVGESLQVELIRRPLEVIRPEVENARMWGGADVPPDFPRFPSFVASFGDSSARPQDETLFDDPLLASSNWELVASDATSVTFRRILPEQGLEFTKRYRLEPVPASERDNPLFPGYHLEMDLSVRNIAAAEQSVVYTMSGPHGMPVEGWWYASRISQHWFASGGLRDVVVRFNEANAEQFTASMIAAADVEPMGQGQSLAYAGVDAQYFASVLLPQKEALSDVWFEETRAVQVGPELDERLPKTYANVSFEVERQPIALAAGAEHVDSYRVFLGPKQPELLVQYFPPDAPTYNLSRLIYYGWFGPVAQAMLAVLHFFYGIVGNYGIAIILLTVLVRGCLFPLSLKQTQSMTRMQALKPEIDRITEKYKTDMQKRSQAMQELYRKHNINPLSGCLPMLIQLPIFIGLYRALMVDVELRQSPLFSESIRWCSNLAAPDMFYDWSWLMPEFINNGIGLFGLGPYLNILPLVTVGLFLVSQKMFMPEPTNEQAAMQQTIMKYMTIFMGLLFYRVASGLCIYFITSSLWGIAERKLLPKVTPADEELPTTAGSGAATGASRREKKPAVDERAGRNGSPPTKKRPKAKRRK